MHFNDLTVTEKQTLTDLAEYLKAQLPARCVATSITMRGNVCDVILTGSFANSAGICGEYICSDYDVLLVIDDIGLCYDFFTVGDDLPNLYPNDLTKKVIKKLWDDAAKQYSDLLCPLNIGIRGYNCLRDNNDGTVLGLSLINEQAFADTAAFNSYHELGNG